MPKIDKAILIRFGQEPQEEYIQNWPKGSQFLGFVTLPEGIYTVFSVPNVLQMDKAGIIESDQFTFVVIKPGENYTDNMQFLDVLSVFTEMTPESLKEQGLPSDYQAVILFPIFMKN